MTTRGQNLRSSTPGNKPAAGSRAPGEVWINFADHQLGYIDAGKASQPVVAVRFFATTSNYAIGDFVVQGGNLWVATTAVSAGAFNSAQWSRVAETADIPVVYVLPTASPTVLGGVKIDGTTIKIDGGGVISASGLAAVMTTPPVSPQTGSQWFDLVGGQLYIYVDDGTSKQWVVAVNQSLGGVYLPLGGGTLTGPLTLAGDPTTPLGAATKQYADTMLPLSGGTVRGNVNFTSGLTVGGLGIVYGTGNPGIFFEAIGGWGMPALSVAISGQSMVPSIVTSGATGPFSALGNLALSGGSSLMYAWYSPTQSVTWTIAFSDRRLKTAIKSAAKDALAALKALKVHEFDLTPPFDDAQAQHWNWGLIADEVEAHIPSAHIPASESSYASLRELPLIAALVKAVQQLSARIEALEAGAV